MQYKISCKYGTRKPYATLSDDGGLKFTQDNYTVFTSLKSAKRAIQKQVKKHPTFFNEESFTIEEIKGE